VINIRHIYLCLSVIFSCAGAAANAAQQSTTTDFSRPEAGEQFPAGAATHRKKLNQDAFSHPSANLSFEQQLDFRVGNGVFKKIWVSSPSSTTASDGLGPLFNARSCQRCHLKDGRGHPPAGNWPEDHATSMFLRLSIPPQNEAQKALLASGKAGVIPEPTYGGQLQDFAVQGVAAEGRMHIRYEEQPVTLADGTVINLRKPTYTVTDTAFGPLHPETMLSPRVAPPMIGLGLLELIPEQAILANADPNDKNRDGISGRPNQVWDLITQQTTLGRFGYKAGNPNLQQQNSGAFNGDIGISTAMFPSGYGDCTEQQPLCLKAPNGNSEHLENVEAPSEMMKALLLYTRNLAVPARRNVADAEVLAGKKLFYQTGCVACHQPSYTTGHDPAQPHLSGQKIWPYTDLLLHDMGEGLADNRPEFLANGREWKTPPLWGIGQTKTVNNHSFFLHDGRARNLLEAILWHGGEAQQQQQAVVNMSRSDREHLLRFLESL